MNAIAPPAERLRTRLRTCAAIAVVAGVASLGLCIFAPQAFWPAYLLSVMFVLGLGLGCLAALLLHRLTGGRWGFLLLRELTAAAGTLPFIVLLLIPLIFGGRYLYPWLQSDSPGSILNEHQQSYFEPAFWIGRGVFYAVFWSFLAWFAGRGYLRLAQTGDTAAWYVRQRLSALGLLILWLTMTFASFDWLMALEPEWNSTIYGAKVSMGFVLSGWAMAIATLFWLRGPQEADVTHDLGNLLLAFLMIWVYLSFSQFLIIWSGDLPVETVWYQRRMTGVWGAVGTGLLLFHFVIPFAVLLIRENKRSLKRLAWLAAGLLVMRALDLAWTILPAFPGSPYWIVGVPVTLAAMTALWFVLYLWRWQQLPALASDLIVPAEAHRSSDSMAQEATS